MNGKKEDHDGGVSGDATNQFGKVNEKEADLDLKTVVMTKKIIFLIFIFKIKYLFIYYFSCSLKPSITGYFFVSYVVQDLKTPPQSRP